MNQRILTIKERLASENRQMNAPLSEDAIRAFESRYNIKLPVDYAMFLQHIGNGGAGPGCGLVKLEETLYSDMEDEDSQKVDPASPFPHTKSFLIVEKSEAEADDEEGYEEDFEEEEKYYYRHIRLDEDAYYEELGDPRHIQGLLRLANGGCGTFFNLIVNGAEYGNMWIDASYGNPHMEIFPVCRSEDESDRLTFLDWYELWLNDQL